MGVYQVGEVIKRTRESLGITQEELSDGICSVENLSRIENGKTTPNRANFEALMEKLGKTGKKYLPFVRGKDMETHLLQDKIAHLISNDRYVDIPPILEKVEQKLDLEDKINQQYILRVKALTKYNLGEISEEEKRQMLEMALRCTIPRYENGELTSGILTRMEIFIFCNIAASYAEEGNLEKAIEILKQLEVYFQNTQIDKKERESSEVLALSNLAQCLGRAGFSEEAKKRQEKIKDICILSGHTASLMRALYSIAYNQEILKENQQDCKEKLMQAYYVARFSKSDVMVKHIIRHVQDVYGEDFAKRF